MEITIRPATAADGQDCGRICYEAFAAVANRDCAAVANRDCAAVANRDCVVAVSRLTVKLDERQQRRGQI